MSAAMLAAMAEAQLCQWSVLPVRSSLALGRLPEQKHSGCHIYLTNKIFLYLCFIKIRPVPCLLIPLGALTKAIFSYILDKICS